MSEEIKTQLVQALGPEFEDNIDLYKDFITSCNSPDIGEFIKENVITCKSVITGTSYSLKEYLNAVRFASLITSGTNDLIAFETVFPERIKKIKSSNISASIRSYKQSKLVQKVLNLIRIPLHLLFYDKRAKAIVGLEAIAEDTEVSNKVRVDAYDAILRHLEPPKESIHKVQVNDESTTTVISILTSKLASLAQQKQKDLEEKIITVDAVGKERFIDHGK